MSRAVLLCSALALFAVHAHATSIGSDLIPCSHCSESYIVSVVRSWNYGLSGGAEPPVPKHVCPHCLYGWKGGQAALAGDARVRVDRALAGLGENIPAPTRRRLLQTLGSPDSGAGSALSDYVVEVCRSAVAGRGDAPVVAKFSTQHRRSPGEGEDEFRRLLPKMIAELRTGSLRTFPKGSGDREMGALFVSRNLIADGDAGAAEFALLWLRTANIERVKKCDYAVARILAALGKLPRDQWPAMPQDSARVPLLGVCLGYLRDGGPAPKALRAKLDARGWDELTGIVAACCTIRGDSSVAGLFAKRLRARPDVLAVDELASYYAQLGRAADLPLIRGYGERLYPKQRSGRDWEGSLRGDMEDAMRTIRLREILLRAERSED